MTATTRLLTGRLGDRTDAYGRVSQLNHWIGAAIFLVALGLGLVLEYGGLAREAAGGLMNWHKALGVSVLAFGVWRVGWRIAQGFPEPVPGPPSWQDRVARLVHWMLLAAIILMPLSGVMMTIAGGQTLELWGVAVLPSIGEIGWLDRLSGSIHGFAGLFVAGAVVLHVSAAIKHQFFDSDGTISRMMFRNA